MKRCTSETLYGKCKPPAADDESSPWTATMTPGPRSEKITPSPTCTAAFVQVAETLLEACLLEIMTCSFAKTSLKFSGP